MSCAIDKTTYHDNKLKQYFQNQWEMVLKNSPEFATYLGDHRYNDKLTDMSIKAINQRHTDANNSYDEILKINRNKLSKE